MLRRSTRRLLPRVALAITFALTLVTLLFGSAFAHANIVRSNPPNGASLSAAPSRVQLWFSEELEPSFSSAVIYDANRRQVDLGDSHVAPDDSRSIILGVKPGLPNGTYVIAWQTQSRQDGHIVRGAIPFGVGVSVPPTDTASAEAAPGPVSGSPTETVLRWFVLTSAGLVVGAFAFWLLQRNSLKEDVGAPDPGLLPGQQHLAVIGLIGFAVGNVGILLLQTSTAADVPLLGIIGAPLVLALSGTRYGEIWIVRMVAAAVIGLILFARGQACKRPTSEFSDWVGLGTGLVLLAKIIIIFPLVAVAAVNHYVIRPALTRTRSTNPKLSAEPTNGVRRLFAWTVRVEVVLVVAIVGFVGIMTSMSPAQQAAVAGSSSPLTLEAAAGDLRSTIEVSPAIPGPNRYTINVRDASGQPATDVARATLRLTFLDSDLGVAEVALTPAGVGRFEGQSSDLAVAGQWQVEAIFRRAGQDDVRSTYQFGVTATGGQTLEAPPPQVSVLFFAGLLVGLVGLLAFGRASRQRRRDVRRAAILAVCGVGLVGSGAFVSFQDFQQAQIQATSLALARFHPVTPESVADGALVFRENCVRCHGIDAHGNGPLAPTLNPRPSDLILHVPLHPDVDLVNWISNGFPGSAMPAFQTVLTEQQRWDVLNYLKSLSEPSATLATIAATSTGLDIQTTNPKP